MSDDTRSEAYHACLVLSVVGFMNEIARQATSDKIPIAIIVEALLIGVESGFETLDMDKERVKNVLQNLINTYGENDVQEEVKEDQA
jgi:hypothetical protein